MTNQLNYQKLGNSSEYLILIHGLFGSLENLNMVAKSLAETYTVISVDVRNHGASFHKEGMEYSALANDVVSLLDDLGIEKAHILGHSMGGKIAMQIALNFPERVEKLIVADIAPVQYPAHHQRIIEGLKSLDFTTIKNRKDADSQLSAFVDDAGVRQFLLRNLSSNESGFALKCNVHNIADGYADIMKGQNANTPSTHQTLFIKGGNSDYITAEYRDQIASLFPNSKARIIHGTGHWLHAEKPQAFNKVVKDFLA